MSNSFKIKGLDNVLNLLQTLPKEVTQSKQGGMVGKSLKAGAKVIHAEEKITLQRAIDANPDDTDSTGLLMKNLKVRRAKYKGKGKGERVTIGVGNKKYPGHEGEKGKTTRLNATRLEYGTEHQPATPWVRPAFDAKKQEALDAVVGSLNTQLADAIAKHLKG